MVINALFPVLAVVFLGAFLRHIHFLDTAFYRTGDKLVYYVFFPIMLFSKLGAAPLDSGTDWHYLAAALSAVFTTFLISVAFIRYAKVEAFQAGSFSQSCYRFNSYIGMAIVLTLFGAAGARLYGILIGVVIPCINVMCVAVLIWHSGEKQTGPAKFLAAVKSLLANPLVLSCCCGIIYSQCIGGFPQAITNSLNLLSSLALPMALLSIGGDLSFSGINRHRFLALSGAAIKLTVLPLVGLIFLYLFGVQGLAWKVTLIFFTLPTSSAIYILSAQLKSDTELAVAAIMVSTIGAFLSMSVAIHWIEKMS